MKKVKLNSAKLSIKKNTIVKLTSEELSQLDGGWQTVKTTTKGGTRPSIIDCVSDIRVCTCTGGIDLIK